jgi:hypothetical protein
VHPRFRHQCSQPGEKIQRLEHHVGRAIPVRGAASQRVVSHAGSRPLAIGIYLPLELSVPIFAGGLLAHVARARSTGSDHGTLFAAGLITGEALLGITLAIPIVLTGTTEFMAVPEAWQPGALAGLAAVAVAAVLLYRAATDRN